MYVLALTVALANAGYGDQDEAGRPSAPERELHLLTNLVRLDPGAFAEEYARGGCAYEDFPPEEQEPQPLLGWSAPLGAAARYHSEDMAATGSFSHDSSDGTTFEARLASFYTESGAVGENIAYGYPDPWTVLFQGWMCSAGHRSNILHPEFRELGTGVVETPGPYYTQDFGGGSRDRDEGVLMAAHRPQRPGAGEPVTFLAVHDGPAPLAMELVLDGTPHAMEPWLGDETEGAWSLELPVEGECACYHVLATLPGGATSRFPEEGDYLVGPDCPEPDWVAAGPPDDTSPPEGGEALEGLAWFGGCAVTPGAAGCWWLLPGLLALARRRRLAGGGPPR